MRALLLLCLVTACGRVSFVPYDRDDGASSDAMPIVVGASASFAAPTSEIRRTLTTPSATTRFTFASWYKPRAVDLGSVFFDAGIAATQHAYLFSPDTTGIPTLTQQEGSTYYGAGPDYGAATWPYIDQWAHIVIAVDTTQPALADRVRWWVNGVAQAVSTGTMAGRIEVPQDLQLYLGAPIDHAFGRKFDGAFHWSGSLAETYVIWDVALDASSFIAITSDGPRSIAYAGPVSSESVYFDYQVPGRNLLPGQPDWTTIDIVTSSSDLPY